VDASAISSRLIGSFIVEKGLITEEQLERALEEQQATGRLLGEILVERFSVTREALESALETQRAANEAAGTQEDSYANAAVRELQAMLDAWGGEAEPPKKPIGQIFVERGFISSEQLEDALEEQKWSGRKLGEILMSSGNISRLRLWDALEEQAASFDTGTPAAAEPQAPAAEPSSLLSETETASLRGALDTLAAQVAELGAPDESWKPELQAATERLAERLERLEQESVLPPTGGQELDDLRAELAALAARLDDLPAPSEDWRDAVAALAARVDELGSEDDSTDHVSALTERLDALATALATQSERVSEAVATTASKEQTDALRAELDSLQHRIEQLPSPTGDVELLIERVDQLDHVRHDVEELRAAIAALPAPTGDLDALDERLARLTETVDAHVDRFSTNLAGAATREQADALRHELDGLRNRIDDLPVVSGDLELLAERIDRLDHLRREVDEVRAAVAAISAPTGDLEALEERVAGLTDTVNAQVERFSANLAGAATREQTDALRHELDGLRNRIDDLPVLTGDLAALVQRVDHLDQVRGEISELRAALAALPTPTGDLDAVEERVDRLAENVGAHVDRFSARLAETATREQADALRRELDNLRETVGSLPEPTGWHDPLSQLGARVDDLAAGSNEARDALEHLNAQLDRLSSDLGGAASVELVSSLRHDLEQLRQSFESAPDDAEWREAVAVIAHRVDDIADDSSGARDTLGHLTAQLDRLSAELAAAASVDLVDTLRHDLEQLRRSFESAPDANEWREAVTVIAHHVDELSERKDDWRGEVDRLSGRVEELAGRFADTADAGRVEALRGELDGLREAIETIPLPSDEWRHAVAALAVQFDDARASSEEWRGAVAALAVRLDDIAEPSHEWRAELTPQLDRLRERVGSLEHGLAATAPAGAVDALTDRLEEIAQRLEKNERRLEKLARRADELAPLHRVEGLIDAIADTAGKQSAIHERLDGLDTALSEARVRADAMEPFTGRVRELEHRVASLRDELAEAAAEQSSSHAQELDAVRGELAEQGRRSREAVEAREAENTAVQARLAHVEVSLTDANTRVAALEPLQARLNELELTLAEATSAEAAARKSDLNAVRSEIAALGGELALNLAQLQERDEQDEAATRATAQAIRDGLAELGRRLTASEEAYLESGRGLRRSIEGLGLAISAADGHLGRSLEEGGQTAYVAFVTTDDGYRVVDCEGAPPFLGQVIELPGHEGTMLRVARLGRSPLPFDDRPCAYLEPVSSATG
jgi:chromosome segregation ATPase